MSKPFLADMAIEEVRSRLQKIKSGILDAESLLVLREAFPDWRAAYAAKLKLTEALAGLKSLLGEDQPC